MDGNSLGWQAKFRCNRRTVPTSGPLLTWLVRTFISITDTAGHSKKKKKRRDIEEKIFESTLNKTLEHIRNLLDDFNYAESKRDGNKCELKHLFDRFCLVKGHSDLQKDTGMLRESLQIFVMALSLRRDRHGLRGTSACRAHTALVSACLQSSPEIFFDAWKLLS